MGNYEEIYKRSLEDPEGFWGEIAEDIVWDQRWEKVLDDSDAPFYRWFVGGKLNTSYNCLDRWVENGRADQNALVFYSAYEDTKRSYTYRELRDEVARFAGALRNQGVEKGDRVVIYMAMTPEAIIAMLACARLGAIHSVVFGGFSGPELAKRIDDAQPKVLVASSCGIEPSGVVDYRPMVDDALERTSAPPQLCIFLQRPQKEAELRDNEISWEEALEGVEAVDPVSVEATDPLYVLYTSGTTGAPKGVVRDNGGHAVALKWSMKAVYGTEEGETYWAASDIGWVVGHSYIVYGPLLHGCTTVVFEGKPVIPDPGVVWKVIQEFDVKVMFTAPTAFRAIKREDPDAEYMDKYDLSGFRYLFLAGERCDPPTLEWALEKLDRPVIDHWWQTETGWPVAANPMGIQQFEIKPGSATKPVPGWDVQALDDDGKEVPEGEIGNIVMKLPMPPGSLPTLWNNDERFIDEYLARYDGYYLTGDAGKIDEDGYVHIMARIDDVINVAGHRLSTGEMEEVLSGHDAVTTAAVIGVADEMKGEVPVGVVTLSSGVDQDPEQIREELIQRVRDEIGPVASFKEAIIVEDLPQTRSGKILRRTMKSIAEGDDYPIPSTIEDESVLDHIHERFEEAGFPREKQEA